MGISGNRMLGDGAGLGALARFDRDVLAVSGASHVIVLEGVNDIGSAWRDKRWESFDTQALITSYAQMVERAHAHGLKVVLGTILPFKGAGYWSEWGEAQRQKVNSWIRAQKLADGVVDFDAALRDKADPLVIAAAFDCGDHLHPNDAGFTAMAAAVPLALVR
jgi:lysophospholipase L1-like esterase